LLRRDKIREILHKEHPDLVEVGDPYQLGWSAANMAHEMKLPVVSFYHSDYPRALGRTIKRFVWRGGSRTAEKWLRRYLLGLHNQMNATLVASKRMLDILSGCGVKRLHLTPIGIDTNTFSPRNCRQRVRSELGIDQERCLLLFVGRMSREKNIKVLLNLIELLESKHPAQYHLLLVGQGHLDHKVRHAAERLESITWRRHCDDSSKLAEYYSASDLFVHAGSVETYGLTVLEAQACGTPVVALRGGGTDGLNQAGDDFLAGRATAESFMATVEVASGKTSEVLRQKVREDVVSRFNSQATFNRQFEVYRHVLKVHAASLKEPHALGAGILPQPDSFSTKDVSKTGKRKVPSRTV
jgi:alpha-1,6-mannosyltransferase